MEKHRPTLARQRDDERFGSPGLDGCAFERRDEVLAKLVDPVQRRRLSNGDLWWPRRGRRCVLVRYPCPQALDETIRPGLRGRARSRRVPRTWCCRSPSGASRRRAPVASTRREEAADVASEG